jgi:elongation factor P
MYDTNEFRRGLKIEFNGDPFVIVDCQHIKPGKGNAFVRTKIKNLINGNTIEHNFRAGDKVEEPDLEQKEVEYLYQQGDEFNFMDTQNYEQIMISREHLGDAPDYMMEHSQVSVLYYKGVPIGVDIPTFVELKVAHTEPGIRGDTVSGANKNATLETGKVVKVPLFINEGDLLKIDTRTGEYIERINR